MHDQRLNLNRQRGLGDIISDAFAFLTPNWRVFAAAAGPAVVVSILLQIILFALGPDSELTQQEDLTDEQLRELLEDTAIIIGAFLLAMPFAWVIYVLSSASVVVVMKGVGEGQPVNAGDALDAAQDRMKDLLLASLKSFVYIILLMISVAGIPWAIRRLILWLFQAQAIMIDGASHRDALDQSARLVKGRWWLTLGRVFVIGILISLISGAVGSIISAILPGVPGILLAGAFGFFTTPYSIIASTLIYFDYRTKTMSSAPPPPPTPSLI